MPTDPKIKVRARKDQEAVYSVKFEDDGQAVSKDYAYKLANNTVGEYTLRSGDHVVLATTAPETDTRINKDSNGNHGSTYDIHQAIVERAATITLEVDRTGGISGGVTGQNLDFNIVFRDKYGQDFHTIRVHDEQTSKLNPKDNPVRTIRMVDDNLKPVLRNDNFQITPEMVVRGSKEGFAIGQDFLKDGKELIARKIVAPTRLAEGLSEEQIDVALNNHKTVEALMSTTTPNEQLRLATERAQNQARVAATPVKAAPAPHISPKVSPAAQKAVRNLHGGGKGSSPSTIIIHNEYHYGSGQHDGVPTTPESTTAQTPVHHL